LTYFNKDFIP